MELKAKCPGFLEIVKFNFENFDKFWQMNRKYKRINSEGNRFQKIAYSPDYCVRRGSGSASCVSAVDIESKRYRFGLHSVIHCEY